MAEIIYLKDVLFIKSNSNAKEKKGVNRLRSKSSRSNKILKSSLIERKKEDVKSN